MNEELCVQCGIKPRAKKKRKCNGCRSLNYRTKFPERKAFYDLRSSAKKRNLEFTLTLSEFIDLVIPTGYMEKRGRFYDSLTIDRKKNKLGYTRENVRVISKSINSAKGAKEDYPF